MVWPKALNSSRTIPAATRDAANPRKQTIMAHTRHALFPLGPDTTPYRKLTSEGVTVERMGEREMIVVEPEALRLLAEQAMMDINHLLRPGHLAQLRKILDDPRSHAK